MRVIKIQGLRFCCFGKARSSLCGGVGSDEGVNILCVRIAIEAGHGYKGEKYDPGAVARHNGIKYEEAVIAYEYALTLRFVLRSHGIEATIIPNQKGTGLSLFERANFVQRNSFDAVVSIHLNAHTNKDANGIETLYRREIQRVFAETLHQGLKRAFPSLTDRGLKQQKLAILAPNIPGALLELGFITNADDIKSVRPEDEQTYRAQRILFAQQITASIIRFFGH